MTDTTERPTVELHVEDPRMTQYCGECEEVWPCSVIRAIAAEREERKAEAERADENAENLTKHYERAEAAEQKVANLLAALEGQPCGSCERSWTTLQSKGHEPTCPIGAAIAKVKVEA